jgi:hypothetical protein
MNKVRTFRWFVEKVLVPLLIALIAAYATLVTAKILPNPFSNDRKIMPSTFSSISSNSLVNGLFEGQTMISPNEQHILKITNGNLILYSSGSIAWTTNTEWSGADRLLMQADGNLVLYANDRYVWDTDTPRNPPAKSYTLNLINNGNLIIYDSEGNTIWSIK